MNDRLTIEIIKRLLQHVGVNPPNTKDLALFNDLLKTKMVVESMVETGVVTQHPVYAGEINLPNFLLKGLLIDLTIEDDYEFCFCWRSDQNPILGIRFSFTDEDEAVFRIFLEKQNGWKNLDMYNKAMVLAGFERITS